MHFGQTFGYWGIPQGPYLFVPLWGPTTVRDGSGWVVRFYTGPIGYIPDVPARNVLYGIGAVDSRAQALSAESIVDQAALTGLLTGHTEVTNDVALGTGKIDYAPILVAAKKAGVKWYFIEDESPTSEQQIPMSLKYLEQVKF